MNPVSNIESCTEDSRLLLSFQACPDVSGTESTGTDFQHISDTKDAARLHSICPYGVHSNYVNYANTLNSIVSSGNNNYEMGRNILRMQLERQQNCDSCKWLLVQHMTR